MINPVIIPIIFFAFVTFGLTGFGSALIAMPLLIPLLGLEVATPLVAMMALVAQVLMLIRFRDSIAFSTIWRLVLASLLAIPIGLTVIRRMDSHVVLLLLGCLVAAYGLYGLLRPHLPQIKNPNWAFAFGFAGGLLSGAYNTGGPPVVIYANLLHWSPAQFRSNLGGAFLLNSLVVVAAHIISGNVTPVVLQAALLAFPSTVVGMVAGWWIERFINPTIFRKLVLFLLVLIGLSLILLNL